MSGKRLNVRIVMYHYVRDLERSRYPGIKGLNIDQFRLQIEYLTSRYKIIRMEELLESLENNENNMDEEQDSLCEHPEREAVLLTFDDGYIDHYLNVFPILDAYRVQGSFFPTCAGIKREELLMVNKIHLILASADISAIYDSMVRAMEAIQGREYDMPDSDELISRYSDPYSLDAPKTAFVKRMLQSELPRNVRSEVSSRLFREFVSEGIDESVFARELYCDEHQLMVMKRHGMYIGVHGYNHEWMGKMDRSGYESELTLAVDEMSGMGLINSFAWAFNYPYGSWNKGLRNLAEERGCVLGLTTARDVADTSVHDRLLLPRIDTNEFPPKSTRYSELAAKATNKTNENIDTSYTKTLAQHKL